MKVIINFMLQYHTPTSYTGPSWAAEGNYYFYFDSNGILPFATARFVSKTLETGTVPFLYYYTCPCYIDRHICVDMCIIILIIRWIIVNQ